MKRSTLVSLLVLATSLVGLHVQAQIDRGALGGTLKDEAGKVVPGIHISAVQDSTHLERSTTSNSEGLYAIAELPIGTYTVTLIGTGFQPIRFHRRSGNRRTDPNFKRHDESGRPERERRCLRPTT
jgi:hypothetical protein